MQYVLRLASISTALALILYGLFLPVEAEILWLVLLWSATALAGLAIWLGKVRLPRGLARSVYHLGLVFCLGFGLLSIQLLRQQVTRAEATFYRIESDGAGQTISNVRPVLAAQRIMRGDMFASQGELLVSSETVDGFVRRTYPLAEQYDPAAFSNIVGYLSPRFGQSGLEASYSEYLSGEYDSPVTRLRDEMLGNTREGSDLYLTLRASLQNQARALLGNRRGSVVVLDPQSGAVLAMVSVPGFNPAELSFNPAAPDWAAENARISAYWELLQNNAAGQPLLNRPTQGQYPPGSIFKTLTAVAALQYATLAEPDAISCPNVLEVTSGAPPVRNAVDFLSGLTGNPSDLERVYAYSCNTAFAQYALRIGPDRFSDTARAFDIFAPADLPNRYNLFADLPTLPSRLYVQPGFLAQPSALADTGYGQGQLLVTPLHMALMAATIANDGVMMRPYLVERIVRADGEQLFQHQPVVVRRVMTETIAGRMRANMRAVARYGFGSVISDFVPGVVPGGKSGTAEHAPGASPHAWFIAIAPIDDPRYAVAVMIENGGEGSSVGATLAGQVLQAAFATE
jgi:penicillin-binding protein A